MFENKVALITGGARGIGRAAAELLSAGGAQVAVGDLDGAAAQETAAELPGEALAWSGDLTVPGAADELVAATVERWGRIDVIVNNAGYTLDAPLHKLGDDAFEAMLAIHTIAPFRVLRAAAPHLREPAKREREAGAETFRKVVNVTSVAAYGNAGQANYSAGKAGVIGLTKALAREWGPLRINVNAVAYGLIDTRLTAARDDAALIDIGGRSVQVGLSDQARAALAGLIPLGRSGTVQEAAGGIAFLASPWSDYVTGQVLNVSGGMPIGMAA